MLDNKLLFVRLDILYYIINTKTNYYLVNMCRPFIINTIQANCMTNSCIKSTVDKSNVERSNNIVIIFVKEFEIAVKFLHNIIYINISEYITKFT